MRRLLQAHELVVGLLVHAHLLRLQLLINLDVVLLLLLISSLPQGLFLNLVLLLQHLGALLELHVETPRVRGLLLLDRGWVRDPLGQSLRRLRPASRRRGDGAYRLGEAAVASSPTAARSGARSRRVSCVGWLIRRRRRRAGGAAPDGSCVGGGGAVGGRLHDSRRRSSHGRRVGGRRLHRGRCVRRHSGLRSVGRHSRRSRGCRVRSRGSRVGHDRGTPVLRSDRLGGDGGGGRYCGPSGPISRRRRGVRCRGRPRILH
mmetsp:Transcript_67421/g.197142  ORF Transcript_67421/g.197142 Transcript_67421/m.197142 type:complete len:260 (-) Transcript_67421:144-923(-)